MCFYVVLFSASEQTAALHNTVLNTKKCRYPTVCYAAVAMYSCCHLLTATHQFTVLVKATHHSCLALTCHLHFWQNDQDLVNAAVVTVDGTEAEIRVGTES